MKPSDLNAFKRFLRLSVSPDTEPHYVEYGREVDHHLDNDNVSVLFTLKDRGPGIGVRHIYIDPDTEAGRILATGFGGVAAILRGAPQ